METIKSIDRRKFIINSGLTAASLLLPLPFVNSATLPFSKNKDFKGVNVGVITYSFRSMPGTAEDLIGYLKKLGLNHVELMGDPVEEFAGAPTRPPWKRGEQTDEEKAAFKNYGEEIKKWRTSVSMDKFKQLKKMFNGEGINIDIVKLPIDRMSPEEIDYSFKVAKVLGAKGITVERKDDTIENLSPYADKFKNRIGYHNHAEVNFNSWDEALKRSPYNALNLDIGHYVAGTNESPIPLIEKYHDKILNLHMKDRKLNNGDNVLWGEGDTPIKEVLQLMRDKKYKFMATIEQEYPIPEGSDAVKEVGKCVDFCRDALA